MDEKTQQAVTGLADAAREVGTAGTFNYLGRIMPGGNLNRILEK